MTWVLVGLVVLGLWAVVSGVLWTGAGIIQLLLPAPRLPEDLPRCSCGWPTISPVPCPCGRHHP